MNRRFCFVLALIFVASNNFLFSASCQRGPSDQEAVSASLRAARRVVQKINNLLEASPLIFQGIKIPKLNPYQLKFIAGIFLNIRSDKRDESGLDSFSQRVFSTMQRITLHKKSSVAMNKLIKLCLSQYKKHDCDYSSKILQARQDLFEKAFSCLSVASPSEGAYRKTVLDVAIIAFHAIMGEILPALEAERDSASEAGE